MPASPIGIGRLATTPPHDPGSGLARSESGLNEAPGWLQLISVASIITLPSIRFTVAPGEGLARHHRAIWTLRWLAVAVELVHIGFGNVIAANRVLAIMSPDSAPIRRMIQECREANNIIDVTYGRKTKAVIVLDSGHLVLAAIQPETIQSRLAQQREGRNDAVRE